MQNNMLNPIPILDMAPEISELWDDLMAAAEGVLRSGQFIMGPNVKAFEQEVARYLGVKHAIGVNSGTDALVIALRALDIGPGDEVITTPFTFFATAEAISMVGATPVFADIDPATLNLNIQEVERRITSRTKAVLPVHLYGQAVDMAPLQSLAIAHGLKIVEDVAQAFGGDYRDKKLGTIGDMGAYSFFPSKNLGAFGDGGLIVTNDDGLAETARMLRVHGAKKKYYNEVVGYNSRLDEIQAAFLRVKLPHLPAANQGRREVAFRYNEALSALPGVVVPTEASYAHHVFHQYTIQIKDGRRDAVQAHLSQAGVHTMLYYPVPVHQLPIYAGLNVKMPMAEQAAQEVLSLPIWPHMAHDVQERVITALHDALR